MKILYKLIIKLNYKGFFNWLPSKFVLCVLYKAYFDSKLNLNSPITFNEKLQWLKLHDRNRKYTYLADKYEVKKYISEIIGEEFVIPTLGVWNHFSDIDFSKLPDKFVLKCTHDSGSVIICKNKFIFDKDKAKKTIEKSLKKNYYYLGREWPYKNIKPRIIAEQYLEDESKELKDYKFFCFNGIPKIIQLDFGRFINHQRNIYDPQWNLLNLNYEYKSDQNLYVKKPKNLDEMLLLAKKLSENVPFLRVDFYIVNEKIYFGEMTFYPEAGFGKFIPVEWDYTLGKYLDLSNFNISIINSCK